MAVDRRNLPAAQARLTDREGRATQPFYDMLRRLIEDLAALRALIVENQPQDLSAYTRRAFPETITGQWQFASQIWANSGSEALPGYTFTNDQDTGVLNPSPGQLGISVDGTMHWDINATRVAQSIPLIVTNDDGIRVDNPTEVGSGLEFITFGTADPAGVGNQIAFWERAAKSYGFRFRHAGEVVDAGDLEFWRHNNDPVGSMFMRFSRDSDQAQFGDGSNSLPVVSFINDPDTGFYRSGANNIGVSTGATLRWTFGTAAHVSTLPIRAPFGTDSAPSYSFDGDTDTGMYRFGANQIGWTCNNTPVLHLTNTALTASVLSQGVSGNAGGPMYSFTGDPNTGMYSGGTDILAFSAGGNERFRLAASGQIGLGGANYGTAGQIMTSNGASAAPTWEDPAGASLQTFITKDDETASLVNSWRLSAGANMSFNTSTPGVFELIAAGGSGGITPQTQWREYTDLTGYSTVEGFVTAASVGGTVTFGGSAAHPGVVTVSTGATAATSNGLLKAAAPLSGHSTIFAGGGELTFEALVNVQTLFGGAQTGQMRIGFMDEISGAPSNGIHAQYDETIGVWRLFCRAGGSASSVNGGTTVTTGWHHIEIVVNSGATSVELFVDGVSQGTVTTNIPTLGMTYGAQVQKTAGTTAAVLLVDLFDVYQSFASARW